MSAASSSDSPLLGKALHGCGLPSGVAPSPWLTTRRIPPMKARSLPRCLASHQCHLKDWNRLAAPRSVEANDAAECLPWLKNARAIQPIEICYMLHVTC